MKLRGTNYKTLLKNARELHKYNIDISFSELEAHALCGGDLNNITQALLLLKEKRITVNLKELFALDLAGKDVIECARKSYGNNFYNPFKNQKA